MIDDHSELFTIGQLAERTGLPVRTIRFWSDSDILPPTARSAGGYRLYDTEAVARLDLARTLRELGLGLDTVQKVLDGQLTLADVARAHVRALDAEIRTLQLRRAVLRSVAARKSTTEEMRLMHKLAQLSARERQRIIDEFVDRTFEGVDPDAPGAHIAHAMRQLPTELPEDPTPEQVDAWVELAELVDDPDFQQRVRQMAVTGARSEEPQRAVDPGPVMEHAGGAVTAGITPDSAEGKEILDRIVPADTPAEERLRMADDVETFTDRRVERYWQLLGVINNRPPFPPSVPAFEWLVAALRAHA
ncbi:helix-turn-helix domain-containing protein [Streptoalloteichus hindustanus]|uniref:DNA-binding transcriptional regulator, MerR family n=1 Tax=Streptoalloteichus hindustanus TaxID=2017 RepID=A0A1M5DDE4_STRHI|nr:MerR family transcriptional regulator [Streptoalloteichus hindustanus]SHF64935.1 DNA-binding transcriptional regulator, MerR family [Streptoalloteichus hindustanus]